MNDALGIIETINPQNNLAGSLGLDDPGGVVRHLDESVVRNSNGQSSDPDGTPAELNELVPPVDFAAQTPGTAVQKVSTVVFNVEADQIATCKFKTKI